MKQKCVRKGSTRPSSSEDLFAIGDHGKLEQSLELGALKRQTGNGLHWAHERVDEYFLRFKDRLDSPEDYLSGGK